MQALDRLEWEILNVTADDCENLEQIYLGVCYEMIQDAEAVAQRSLHSFRRITQAWGLSEVASRIRDLVGKGMLSPVMDENGQPIVGSADPSYVWRAWFEMTPEGRRAWDESEFATLLEQESS